MEIELIDLRRLVFAPQLFEAYGAQGRNTEHCAIFRCCGCDGSLALMMEEALKSGGRTIEWQGEFLAHDRDGQVDGLNAPQHIGQEVAALEACSILAKGRFVIRSAVDIIENWAW